MIPGVSYERIDEAGLHITVNGEAKMLPVDTIVVCAGQESRRELKAPLEAAGIPVTLIGSVVAAQSGARLGELIGPRLGKAPSDPHR